MKRKTKRKAERAVLYLLAAIFIAGTFLLYLPITQTAPRNNPPALNAIPADQLNRSASSPLPVGTSADQSAQQTVTQSSGKQLNDSAPSVQGTAIGKPQASSLQGSAQ